MVVKLHKEGKDPLPLHPHPRKANEYGRHCSVQATSLTDLLSDCDRKQDFYSYDCNICKAELPNWQQQMVEMNKNQISDRLESSTLRPSIDDSFEQPLNETESSIKNNTDIQNDTSTDDSEKSSTDNSDAETESHCSESSNEDIPMTTRSSLSGKRTFEELSPNPYENSTSKPGPRPGKRYKREKCGKPLYDGSICQAEVGIGLFHTCGKRATEEAVTKSAVDGGVLDQVTAKHTKTLEKKYGKKTFTLKTFGKRRTITVGKQRMKPKCTINQAIKFVRATKSSKKRYRQISSFAKAFGANLPAVNSVFDEISRRCSDLVDTKYVWVPTTVSAEEENRGSIGQCSAGNLELRGEKWFRRAELSYVTDPLVKFYIIK